MNWAATIGGWDNDVAILADCLPPPSDPHVIVLDAGSFFLPVLRSKSFDTLATPLHVHDAAVPLIRTLAGLIALGHQKGLAVGSVGAVEFLSDGHIRHHKFRFANRVVRVETHPNTLAVFHPSRDALSEPQPTFAQRAVHVVSGDALDALHYFHRGSWNELWKAFEAIGAHYGSTDDKTYIRLGALPDALADFRTTANDHHRHHRWRVPPRPRRASAVQRKALTNDEGREFVRELIMKMFEEIVP